MAGPITPCLAEPGSQPLRSPNARCPSELPSSTALAARRWQAPHSRPYPHIAAPEAKREASEIALPRSLADRLKALASEHGDLAAFLADLASTAKPDGDGDLGDSDCAAFTGGLPLEPAATSRGPQPYMQSLMHDFRRRQRQASLLVAGCIATSVVLTAIGIAMLASFARPTPANAEPLASNSTSVAWRKPQTDSAPVRLTLVATAPDEAAKSEPLRVPARAEAAIVAAPLAAGTTPQASGDAAPKLILLTAGRPLALAPLLSQRQARYVLVRGLPSEAALSAGQRNPSGAWLVKDKDLGQLTLSIGGAASGDYPVEIYALGTDRDAPQARQRLVFRVAPAPRPNAALDTSAGQALVTMALADASRPEGAVPAETSALMARAVSRYERVSETGSIKAAERLKTLASLSD